MEDRLARRPPDGLVRAVRMMDRLVANGIGGERPAKASPNPTLPHLATLGYTPLSRRDAHRHRGGRLRNVLLDDILADRLLAINSFSYRGRRYRFDLEDAHEAIQRLHPTPDRIQGLRRTNQAIYDLLVRAELWTSAVARAPRSSEVSSGLGCCSHRSCWARSRSGTSPSRGATMPRVVDPGSNPVTVKSRAALSQRGFAPRPPLRPVAARRVALSAVFTKALRARIRESTLICPSASSRPQRRNLYACLVRGRSPVSFP